MRLAQLYRVADDIADHEPLLLFAPVLAHFEATLHAAPGRAPTARLLRRDLALFLRDCAAGADPQPHLLRPAVRAVARSGHVRATESDARRALLKLYEAAEGDTALLRDLLARWRAAGADVTAYATTAARAAVQHMPAQTA